MKKVIKRDGSQESFDPEKIVRVLSAAGLKESEARDIAKTITAWAKQSQHAALSTDDIREQIIAELQRVNEYIAGLFQRYEKTKDNARQA